MNNFWDAATLRFMEDAALQTDFYQRVTDWLLMQLSPDAHVCDAGCGLGFLSLALAPHVRRVTAVDVCPEALAVLRRHQTARNLTNLQIQCGDIAAVQPAVPYDAMVFCLFGEYDLGLRVARRQCRGDVFLVLRDDPMHRFSACQHPVALKGFTGTCQLLTELGIPFTQEKCALDFGQPLRSREEARRFFLRHSVDDPAAITDAFLDSRLVATQDDKFPLYMPHTRRLGLIRLRSADIPPLP